MIATRADRSLPAPSARASELHDTAAIANLLGGDDAVAGSRTPQIRSDAAHAVLVRDPRSCTGTFFLDEEVLAQEGLTDLDGHHAVPGSGRLDTDLFLDPLEDDA